MRRTNIRDVAKAAGVSVATVSKALNGYQDVNPETRRRVLDVANKLNYVADTNARNMGGKVETTTIALLVNGLRSEDPSGFVFGILSGTHYICKRRNCDFMLLTTSSQEQEMTPLLQLCRQKSVNGIVASGFRLGDPYIEQMKEIDLPVAFIDMDEKGRNVFNVSIDNVAAAKRATEFLIQKGHRDVAMLNGTPAADVSRKRYRGYCLAFEEAGLAVNTDYLRYCDFDEGKAIQATLELLQRHPRITAIFAASDLMAIGACRAIGQLGMVPGTDIDVIGFDDIPIAKYLTLRDIDLTKYKNQDHVGSLFEDYDLEQVNKIQVTKQADTLLLFLLMENLFDLRTKKANWDYYEPRTLHDSSLSLSTHCIIAADMNDSALAYDLFRRAAFIDAGPDMKSSSAGIHAGSVAGIWQCAVFGFGGVRMLDGRLRIRPALPEAWSRLEFTIFWQGSRLHVVETKDSVVVEKLSGDPVTLELAGETVTVDGRTEKAL